MSDGGLPVPPGCPSSGAAEPAGANTVTDPTLSLVVEIWKKTVDVQQHFNEIEMKIRNLAVTLLVGVIGAAALALENELTIEFARRSIPLAAAVLVGGLIGWVAFFSMEHYWYHVFLKAAGAHAGKIEDRWQFLLPALGLSKTISDASGAVRVLHFIPMGSTARLRFFYLSGVAVLTIMLLAVVWGHAPRREDRVLDARSTKTANEALREAATELSRSAQAVAAAAQALSERAAQSAPTAAAPAPPPGVKPQPHQKNP